jgi:transcriptional regulator with XRE-family HTH domain
MPPLDKSRVLGMLFRGYSAREVAKKFGVSNVTVSKTLRDFVSEAEGVNSVLAAAEKYGIEEQVRQLIAIGDVVEETKVDASRAGLGLRIVKAVEGFGVDPDGVPGFIEAVNKEASDQHLSAETFVKVVKGIHGLLVDGKSDYVALEKAVEAKRGEFERLDDQVYEYEGKAEEAKKQMDEMVEKKNSTLGELEDYVALRDRLKPHGLDLRDVDKAEKCLLNIKEQGSDPVAVVAVLFAGRRTLEKG